MKRNLSIRILSTSAGSPITICRSDMGGISVWEQISRVLRSASCSNKSFNANSAWGCGARLGVRVRTSKIGSNKCPSRYSYEATSYTAKAMILSNPQKRTRHRVGLDLLLFDPFFAHDKRDTTSTCDG